MAMAMARLIQARRRVLPRRDTITVGTRVNITRIIHRLRRRRRPARRHQHRRRLTRFLGAAVRRTYCRSLLLFTRRRGSRLRASQVTAVAAIGALTSRSHFDCGPSLPLFCLLARARSFTLFNSRMISWTTITVWTISALLAAGVGWSRYEKKKNRDKFLAELAAMDRERREKLLARLQPDVQTEIRQQLMLRYGLF